MTSKLEKNMENFVEKENKKLSVKAKENGFKLEEISIPMLQSPDLLIKIIKAVHDEGVQGEEDTILVIVNKINLRNVIDADPTSCNLAISDKTGGGKDRITRAITKIMLPNIDLVHRTAISEKALDYWCTGEDEKNFTWTGKVFYLEDPKDDALKSQSFRVLSSGENEATTVQDQKRKDLYVPGKPVMLVTTMNATIDEEGERRWDTIRVDITSELTERVLIGAVAKAEGKTAKTEDTKLVNALHYFIKPQRVVIPYATEIVRRMNTDLKRSLIMRTRINTLFDYIRSSAVLHQHQRKKDKEGRLEATLFDYNYARFMFIKLKDADGKNLNSVEEGFIQCLQQAGKPISINEAAALFKNRTKRWIYDNLDNLKAKGLIEETVERDEKANKDIMKINACYENINIYLPDLSVLKDLVLNGCEMTLQNQNKEGCDGFVGFEEIEKEINKMRTKNFLKPFSFINIAKPSKPENLPVGGCEKPLHDHIKTSQLERVNELKEYCLKVENNGGGVSETALQDHFNPTDIHKSIEAGLLIRQPDGNYKWGG
jgi:hypothetical protein